MTDTASRPAHAASRQEQPDRIQQLQSLRFLAAFLVLFGHVLMEARQHDSPVPDALYDLPWGAGVDIFFVISGFIIAHIGRAVPVGWRAAGDFLARRLIRVVPLYWLFTLLMAAVILVMPGKVQQTDVSALDLLRSMLFVPYAHAGEHAMRPVLEQGWTLNFEMFFYLLFSVAIALTGKRAYLSAAILVVLVAFAPALPLSAAFHYLFSPLLLLFCAGLAMAEWRARLPRHGTLTTVMIAIAAFVWVALVPAPDDAQDMWARFAHRGIPAIALVYGLIMWRRPAAWTTSGLLPFLGDASYSLYLSHPFTVNAILLVFTTLDLPAGLGFMVCSTVVSVAVSAAVYLMLERPMLRGCTALYRRRTSTPRPGHGAQPERPQSVPRPEGW